VEDTYDKEYVAAKTYGFEKWKDYLLGKEDKVAKSPEWAAVETGIPAREIKALARLWAKKKTMLACGGLGGALCRSAYATEWARMMIYLQAMRVWKNPASTCGPQQGPPLMPTWFPVVPRRHLRRRRNSAAAFIWLPAGCTTSVGSQANNPWAAYPPPADAGMHYQSPVEWHGEASAATRGDAVQNIPKTAAAGHVLEIRQGLHRDHDQYQPLGGCTSIPAYSLLGQPVVFLEEAQYADLLLPACTNGAGTSAVGPSRLYPLLLRLQPTGDRPPEEGHRASGRE
jgi:trimethylamine-N-oxide reductase (cytochrome c)